ncbi:MAG: hypothetical protein RI883_1984 [Bacteroidota bacterium]|jgi:predicted amidohydrolase
MQDLKVALVQANQIWENKNSNLTNYSCLLKNISNIDLIILPEMFHTGFSMNAEYLAETMDNSQGLTWLRDNAKNKNTAIYTSLIIKENGHFFNRGVFVFPNGEVEYYDKRKAFGLAGEDKIYSVGQKEKIVLFKGWKLQLQICYDLRFPEIARNRIEEHSNAAYDAILYVANWPEVRSQQWRILLKARAIENQCFVIGVNRVGVDGKSLEYLGDTLQVNALGEAISLPPNQEGILEVRLSKKHLLEIRERLPFLKDR